MKIRTSALVMGLAIALGSTLAQAAEEARAIDIPAQPLATALRQFAEQTGLQLVFETALTTGRNAPAIKGRLTAREALTRLLTETGLRYDYLDDRTVAVSSADKETGAGVKAATQPDQVTALQKTNTSSRRGEEQSSNEVPQQKNPSEISSVTSPEVTELGAIVVTGTRIRGAASVSPPTVSMSRDDLLRSGVMATEDAIRDLPQNFAGVTPSSALAGESGPELSQLNVERAVGIDLRGLGPESTLTLINNARRAGSVQGRVVDISAIPVSVIERIDVVTGGRSAIYGADAVGGVVNVITRRRFTGAESEISFGTGDGGNQRAQASHIFGASSSRADLVAALDVSHQWSQDIVGTSYARSSIPISGAVPLQLEVSPDQRQTSGYLSGSYAISDSVRLFADVLYTDRTSSSEIRYLNPDASTPNLNGRRSDSTLYGVTSGADIELTDNWTLTLTGARSEVDTDNNINLFFDFGGGVTFGVNSATASNVSSSSLSAVAEGPIFTIGDMTPRLVIGLEGLRETNEFSSQGFVLNDNDRDVRSAFAELYLPFITDGAVPGLAKLEASLAARFDDYSDFGSSTNPQASLLWSPGGGLSFRASYGESFRAPGLHNLGTAQAYLALYEIDDPTLGGAVAPVFELAGSRSTLQPETATTSSVGIEYSPPRWSNLWFSLNYFTVDYEGRIGAPAANFVDLFQILNREPNYAGFIDRAPSIAALDALIASDIFGIQNNTSRTFDPSTQSIGDVFPDIIFFDNRAANIAIERVEGFDASVDWSTESDGNVYDFSLVATYTPTHDKQVTAASPGISQLNDVGKPVDFRARAAFGWSRGPIGVDLRVNYTGSYSNSYATPAQSMSSWTTADLTLLFDGRQAQGFLENFRASLTIGNLFDEAPPTYVSSINGLNFDATNADSIGRYFALRVLRSW